jgi:hypothetical protein
MNKKVLFIIITLFAAQIGVYYFVNKNKAEIDESSSVYLGKYRPNYEGILDLSNQGLTELPKGVLKYKDLRVIRLNDNDFTEFPVELLQMPNLTTISLLNNKIKKVDLSGVDIQCNLSYLILSENKLTEVKALERLQNLDYLYLDNNRLSEIPYLRIRKLRSVNLNRNLIQELEMKQFHINLEILNLAYNEIENIFIKETLNVSLTVLDLSNNQFQTFPSTILKFRNLATLNLSDCGMNAWNVNEAIMNDQPIDIDLSENNFSTFDANLEGVLPNLRSLSLYNNELETFHIKHAQLNTLNIRNNKIEDLKIITPQLTILHINHENMKNNLSNINAPKLRQAINPPTYYMGF